VNYLFVLLLPLALLEMKIWLSVRDWIDILDVSCGPWLIDISFFFFFFSVYFLNGLHFSPLECSHFFSHYTM
jgi:hypothetical protein